MESLESEAAMESVDCIGSMEVNQAAKFHMRNNEMSRRGWMVPHTGGGHSPSIEHFIVCVRVCVRVCVCVCVYTRLDTVWAPGVFQMDIYIE